MSRAYSRAPWEARIDHEIGDVVAWHAGGRTDGKLTIGTVVGKVPPHKSIYDYCNDIGIAAPYQVQWSDAYTRFIVRDHETGKNVCPHYNWLAVATGDEAKLKVAARNWTMFTEGMRPLRIGDNGGCGATTQVIGTNGGTLPCGSMFSCFGITAPYYCPACKRDSVAEFMARPETLQYMADNGLTVTSKQPGVQSSTGDNDGTKTQSE